MVILALVTSKVKRKWPCGLYLPPLCWCLWIFELSNPITRPSYKTVKSLPSIKTVWVFKAEGSTRYEMCHGILLLFVNKTYHSVLPTVLILKLDHEWAKVGYSKGYSATQNLREINFGHFWSPKTAILTIWAVWSLNFF